MANRIVNFQMQQPGEMANPQVVGVQQQNRLSLAERLRKYGLDQDSNGPQSFADSFNQQMRYPMRPEEPLTPQQKASQIMKRYNAKGGGSQFGYELTSGQKPVGMFAGAGDAISRGASNAGGAISRGFGSAVGGFGKLFA